MKNNPIPLLPHWARIIHRLHSLGKLETSYINSIATLTTLGHYPRHITDSSERSSTSLDGSIKWNYLNWKTGLIHTPSDQSDTGASINFFSLKNTPFHLIRLLESKENNHCLNCILKLFTSKKTKHPNQDLPQKNKSQGTSPESIWSVAEKITSSVARQADTQLNLITQGGIVSRKIRFQSINYKNKKIILSDEQNNHLTIDPQSTNRLHTKKTPHAIITTLSDQNQLPILHLKHCA